MRIAILSSSNVASRYAARLIERGHEVIIADGEVRQKKGLTPFLECDGCFLLGDEPTLVRIAAEMERAGKPVWHELWEIPKRK
jgi:hypothetical protein